MINNCKLCGSSLTPDKNEDENTWYYFCGACKEYRIYPTRSYNFSNIIEVLLVGRLELDYNPITKEASLWDSEKIKEYIIEELTPQVALEWRNKLKIYGLFK